MTYKLTPWIEIDIAEEEIEFAKRMRSRRDRQFGNVFRSRKTDERWVGEVGEMILHRWLLAQGLSVEWLINNAAGRPDLEIEGGIRVGVKTVKRNGAPRPYYTAQITARHAEEPVDFFVFLSYDLPRKRMYVLGFISKESFLERAKFYGPGDKVHENYTIRPGHSIYNIEINQLTSALDWINTTAIK